MDVRHREPKVGVHALLASDWAAWLTLLLAAAATLWALPHLHGTVPVHYGLSGRPDRWAQAPSAAISGLGLTIGVYLLLLFAPLVDPRRQNYARFLPTLRAVRLLATLFLAGMLATTLFAGLGHPLAGPPLIRLGISLLFVFLGNLIPRLRPNWFFGIRTPWTLADDEVWRMTHRLGGTLWVAAGIASLILAVWSPIAWVTTMGVAAVVPVVSSYFAWRARHRT